MNKRHLNHRVTEDTENNFIMVASVHSVTLW